MILSLGLDIGTTKSACVVRDTADDKLLFCRSLIHNASFGDGVQSVKKHREVLHELISAIPENLRKDIETIGVTGQMHGANTIVRDNFSYVCQDILNLLGLSVKDLKTSLTL